MKTTSTILLMFLSMVVTANCVTIIDNFPVNSNFERTNAGGDLNAQGFSFTSDSYEISQVSLTLSGLGGGTGFTLNLESDSSGAPSGTSLLSFSGPSTIGSSPATFVFIPDVTLALSANTTYWLTASSSDSVDWYESTNANLGIGTLQGAFRNTGSGWSATGDQFGLQIEANLVPEPSTFILLLLSLPLLSFLRRNNISNKPIDATPGS